MKRWGEILVVTEVALALLMAVGAGLLARSFANVVRVDPGFDSRNVLVTTVGLSQAYDNDDKVDAFMRELEKRTRTLPGVVSSGLAVNVPFTGFSYSSDFIARGRPADGYGSEVGHEIVSPGYFETLKMRLLRGRIFGPQDQRETTPVVVINDALAASYFKRQDPVGQQICFDRVPTDSSTWYTIIGVVQSAHANALDVAPMIEVYESSLQSVSSYMNLLVRTAGDPTALAPAVRGVLREMDASLAPLKTTTMERLRDGTLARIRFLTTMLLIFAVIGVTLSIVGVYGVLSQTSRNRTREVGIRMALGARYTQVRWLIVQQGLRLAVIGIIIGSAAALFSTQLMARMLFQVPPNDPVTLLGVVVILATTSVVASWVPAVRASRVDPTIALRSD